MKHIIKYTFLIGLFPALVIIHHFHWACQFGDALALTPPTSYEIVSSSGDRLEFDSQTGTYLPEHFGHVETAVIESEDRRFLTRRGAFDIRAFFRALIRTLQDDPEGASTIPMQLTRCENPWLRKPEQADTQRYMHWLSMLTRKSIEISFGNCALEQRGHDHLLRDYLRRVPAPTMGIEASSWAVFGKPSKALNQEEAKSLVGLLPSPSSRVKALSKKPPAWRYPYASIAANPQITGKILTFDHQAHIFSLAQQELQTSPHVKDLAVIVMHEKEFVAIVETAFSPVLRPWSWSSQGSIRINSVSKPLTVAFLNLRYGVPVSHFKTALTYSLNEPFVYHSYALQKSSYFDFLQTRYGIHATGEWSLLGRWHCSPIELVRVAGSGKNTISTAIKTMMHSCLTKGTGKLASHVFTFPRSAWIKTGSSPSIPNHPSEILVLGEDGAGHQILIWGQLKKNTPRYITAGQALAPLFGKIAKELSKGKHTLPAVTKTR